jgi:hypothetical protein
MKKGSVVIKRGDYFKKKDTGIVVKVISKQRDAGWRTTRINKNLMNGCHTISAYDLMKFYEKL